jgi:protein SCO1
VRLLRADGAEALLADVFSDSRPVVLNFIYTSCGSICPVMSQSLGDFRAHLGAAGAQLHIVSISIDPEQDTPQALQSYAKRFNGGQGWDYYTGTVTASESVQRAFGVYRGDKMSHPPTTFMRGAAGTQWTRIDGFATPSQLMDYYRQLLATR